MGVQSRNGRGAVGAALLFEEAILCSVVACAGSSGPRMNLLGVCMNSHLCKKRVPTFITNLQVPWAIALRVISAVGRNLRSCLSMFSAWDLISSFETGEDAVQARRNAYDAANL